MSAFATDLDALVAQLNRSGEAPATDAPTTPHPQAPEGLDALLRQAVRQGASDILLLAGTAPVLRVAGRLVPMPTAPLSPSEVQALVLPLLDTRQTRLLTQTRTLDFSFSREGIGRFRANLHHQRGTLAASLRLLPTAIPTLEGLHLPPHLKRLAEVRQGLVLLTGATGCGKSSTLAALLGLINASRADHIVTIEDPIEYVHTHQRSVVEQIEVGQDAPDFASSVRSLLRQTPDVILVGEMRDPETISTVLTAAETGHLVFSTLHTNDTSQAICRILDSFPTGNQRQIRQQLSLALVAVVAQQLVPTADGKGRWPALEILMGTHAVRNLIRKGEDHMLYSSLSTGRADGMIAMEQHLAELVKAGRITQEAAFDHCFRTEDLKRYL